MKQALHTSLPQRLLSRDGEQAAIRSFLHETLLQKQPGSLYISGAPGTGKTACVKCVLKDMKVRKPAVSLHRHTVAAVDVNASCASFQHDLNTVQTVIINCMSVRSSLSIFAVLAATLKLKNGAKGLRQYLSSPGHSV